MPTADVFSRVRALGGAKIPEYSIRTALHTMVRRKQLAQRRDGREMIYTATGKAPMRGRGRSAGGPAVAMPRPVPASSTATAPPGAALPHKLAVGEALILGVSATHVEAVTNDHGRLVVEAHPRRRAASA
jgi:hypothetical protein